MRREREESACFVRRLIPAWQSVMATEGASKSMSTRSPQSEKNFQICRRSLLDAKELHEDDLINDEEYGAMKQAAQADYLRVKSELSQLVVAKKRRMLEASDCSESDEELCPRPKSARTKASTSAQKSQTATQTSTRTRSEKGTRSNSVQQRMSWSRGSKIPSHESLQESAATLQKIISECESFLWCNGTDKQVSRRVPNEVTATDSADGEPFSVWVPCAQQPTEHITDYECRVCQDAKKNGVKQIKDTKVSLLEKSVQSIRTTLRQHNTKVGTHMDALSKRVKLADGEWLLHAQVVSLTAEAHRKKIQRADKKRKADEESDVLDHEGRCVLLAWHVHVHVKLSCDLTSLCF